jgi:hypothetical protein
VKREARRLGCSAAALLTTAAPFILASNEVAAHVMGVTYNLPIPFWMYAFGASAALALSFLMVGFFVTVQGTQRNFHSIEIPTGVPPTVLKTLRGLSVVFCSLATLIALVGQQVSFANPAFVFFWIVFVLGFAYATALIGDLYAFISPWRVACDWIERIRPGALRGRIRYPTWLGYYPAVVLYMGFIWLELFGRESSRTFGLVLLGYGALNLAAAMAFGAETWFRYGEFFAVFLRILGKIAPIAYVARESAIVIRLRQPFIGLIEEPAEHPSIIVFVLFMLSSTAFDGVHETLPWLGVFWKNIYPPLSSLVVRPYAFFVDLYYDWQWAMLWLSPFLYLAIYLFFIWLMKVVTRTPRSIFDLALQFAFTLVPIALVYHITHYYTLLFTDTPRLLPMISDPLGIGWNLFGTAGMDVQPVTLLADGVWHTQVGLILFGHIVSVYLAHAQALRIFQSKEKATWSQFPMLLLMVAFTTAGLWILSLPIAAGQVQDPPPAAIQSEVSGGIS